MRKSCTDCFNYEACRRYEKLFHKYITGLICADRDCEDFKDRSEWVHLPCKIGATLYTNISRQGWYLRAKDRPYECKVVFIGLNDSSKMGRGFLNAEIKNGCMLQFNFSDIGKTVFLTREEAENALAERGKG